MTLDQYWAWAAGIIDGEGTITIAKTAKKNAKTSYSVLLSVGMSHRPTIELVKQLFQCGSISIYPHSRHKTMYKLRVHGAKAIDIVRKLQPLLMTKKTQADLVIEYFETYLSEYKHGCNKPISENAGFKRELIYLEILEANR